METSQGITGETRAGLRAQVRSYRQILLGAGDVDMPQIDGEIDQQCLHIGSLAIPVDQAMSGHGVTQIVEPGLIAGSLGPFDIRRQTQSSEDALGGGTAHGRAFVGAQKAWVGTIASPTPDLI